MATLPGGTTVTTVGLTTQDLQTVSTALTSLSTSGGTSTVSSQSVAPSFADSKTTLSAPIVIGGETVTAVNTVNVAPVTVAGGLVVASVDVSKINTSSGAGSVTNVNVTAGSNAVVLTGTATGTTTAAFIDTSKSTGGFVAAGDQGSNFFVFSGNTTGTTTVTTGQGNDAVILGTGAANVKLGDSGVVFAGNSTVSSTLQGGTGSATMSGGSAGDSVVAGAGGGAYIGGKGADTMTGGAGKDVFIYSPGDGNDSLIGFDPTKDTIGIASTNFGGKTLDIGAIISSAQVVGGNTILTLPDGSTITVAGVTGVSVSWFTAK